MKEAAKKRRNVIAMLDYINKQIHKYFKRLSIAGYEKDDDVMRLLCVIFISDMVGNDFNGFLDECDREIIEKAIYNLTGGCILPYLRINKTNAMNKLHLGDISSLAERVNDMNDYMQGFAANVKRKNKQQDNRLDKLDENAGNEIPEYDEDEEVEYGSGKKIKQNGRTVYVGCSKRPCKRHKSMCGHRDYDDTYHYHYHYHRDWDDCNCRDKY